MQCELFRRPAAEDSRLYVASFSIAVTTPFLIPDSLPLSGDLCPLSFDLWKAGLF